MTTVALSALHIYRPYCYCYRMFAMSINIYEYMVRLAETVRLISGKAPDSKLGKRNDETKFRASIRGMYVQVH